MSTMTSTLKNEKKTKSSFIHLKNYFWFAIEIPPQKHPINHQQGLFRLTDSHLKNTYFLYPYVVEWNFRTNSSYIDVNN